jgi:transcriptional regulator with XRE-family HTH domain
MSTGQQLKEIRKRKGISQKWLANKVGITNQHLCNVENQRYILTKELLNKICDALGVTNDL